MRTSAGILLFRRNDLKIEVFLVHPGGPFWKNKDLGSWSIPKGEFTDEDPLAAAKREFAEETGTAIEGEFFELQPIQQKGGKKVFCWAIEGDLDAQRIVSNNFNLEWPLKSGKGISVPEVDKAEWFTIEEARNKINPAQISFLEEIERQLNKE